MNYTMEFNGFKAQILEAERLTGEHEHELPPGNPLPVYPVEAFKKHPDNWMAEDGCFVVPVNSNRGLWFDWRDNNQCNTAIVPTVKGCNPITGMRTNGYVLERYKNKCPKHDIKFKKDRYCEECGYKWPSQNYITNPNTLWWDGFRETDGTVRQFFFTEEMMRDIASHLIGKEDTVPAFGFAFYSSKKKRYPSFKTINVSGDNIPFGAPLMHHFVPPQNDHIMPFFDGGEHLGGATFKADNGSGDAVFGLDSVSINDTTNPFGEVLGECDNHVYLSNTAETGKANYSADSVPVISQTDFKAKYESKMSSNRMYKKKAGNIQCSAQSDLTRGMAPAKKEVIKKEVAVGAGAKIKQALAPDTYKFNSWKTEPDSIMRIYFIFTPEFNHWKSFGLRDFEGMESGMLNDLPVG